MIIHVNETYLIVNFLIAAIVSIIVALGLRLPLLPNRPIRFSFDKSAIFPTPIFAMGFLAICFSVNFYWIYNGMVLAIFWAFVSALFVKFGFDFVFPKPIDNEEVS
jgi:energy-converting hydrogenase A subunit A